MHNADHNAARDDGTERLVAVAPGVTPEMAAAVAKLMGARDLIAGSARLRVVTRCRNTMGEQGVLGVRIQPNHPSDDPTGVALSVIDGLLMGCGDAVIGINPVNDSVASVSTVLGTEF